MAERIEDRDAPTLAAPGMSVKSALVYHNKRGEMNAGMTEWKHNVVYG